MEYKEISEDFIQNLKDNNEFEEWNKINKEQQLKQYNSIMKVKKLKELKDEGKLLTNTNIEKLIKTYN